mmetsp:Transcript_6285/g.9973  ORF Transcript_6285/g.9973 Transcript_6285/m.9973 type:complete len:210 (+) Transcript_6285:158-787(+)
MFVATNCTPRATFPWSATQPAPIRLVALCTAHSPNPQVIGTLTHGTTMRTRFASRCAIVDHFTVFRNFFLRQIGNRKHQFPIPLSLLVSAFTNFARRRTVNFRSLQIFFKNADHISPHCVRRNTAATRHLSSIHIVHVSVAHYTVRCVGSLQQVFILLKAKSTLSKHIAIITVVLQLFLLVQSKLFVVTSALDAISDVNLTERRNNTII